MVTEESSKFCVYCGRGLPREAKYCDRCGMATSTPVSEPTGNPKRARNLFVTLGLPIGAVCAILIIVSLATAFHTTGSKTTAPGQKMYTSPAGITAPAEMTPEEKSLAEATFNQWINDLTTMDHQNFMQKYNSGAFTWVPGITSYRVASERVLDKYELDYTLKVSGSNQGMAFNDKTLLVQVACQEPEMLYTIHATYPVQQ